MLFQVIVVDTVVCFHVRTEMHHSLNCLFSCRQVPVFSSASLQKLPLAEKSHLAHGHTPTLQRSLSDDWSFAHVKLQHPAQWWRQYQGLFHFCQLREVAQSHCNPAGSLLSSAIHCPLCWCCFSHCFVKHLENTSQNFLPRNPYLPQWI